jgi:hypothetical protein
VVLGPPQPICHQKTEDGVPVEQAVSLQKLRPGSGILSLRVHADGPTRVLEVTDRKLRVNISYKIDSQLQIFILFLTIYFLGSGLRSDNFRVYFEPNKKPGSQFSNYLF